MTDPTVPADADPLALVDAIVNAVPVLDDDGKPLPALAGTFALYGDAGSLVAVLDVHPVGQLGHQAAGAHTIRLPAAMLKAGQAIASGRGPLGKLLARIGPRG